MSVLSVSMSVNTRRAGDSGGLVTSLTWLVIVLLLFMQWAQTYKQVYNLHAYFRIVVIHSFAYNLTASMCCSSVCQKQSIIEFTL